MKFKLFFLVLFASTVIIFYSCEKQYYYTEDTPEWIRIQIEVWKKYYDYNLFMIEEIRLIHDTASSEYPFDKKTDIRIGMEIIYGFRYIENSTINNKFIRYYNKIGERYKNQPGGFFVGELFESPEKGNKYILNQTVEKRIIYRDNSIPF